MTFHAAVTCIAQVYGYSTDEALAAMNNLLQSKPIMHGGNALYYLTAMSPDDVSANG
jgi:hypothetical protein